MHRAGIDHPIHCLAIYDMGRMMQVVLMVHMWLVHGVSLIQHKLYRLLGRRLAARFQPAEQCPD
jgi:hypothetical protein